MDAMEHSISRKFGVGSGGAQHVEGSHSLGHKGVPKVNWEGFVGAS